MPIICHTDLDGFVSALVVVSGKKIAPDGIRYVSYGEKRDELFKQWLLPDLGAVPTNVALRTSTEDVYFLDLSLEQGELEWARGKKKRSRWIWIDHHDSSENFDPKGIFDEVILDTSGENCGADLTYKHVYGGEKNAVIQGWVEAAHDRDLWINDDYRRGLELELMVRYFLKENKFKNVLYELNRVPTNTAKIVYEKQIKSAMESFQRSCKLADSTTETFNKGKQKYVLAFAHGHASDVAEYLRETHGKTAVICLFYAIDDAIVVSLRSSGKVDVARLAEQVFSGGGVKAASGGRLNLDHLKGGYVKIFADICKTFEKEDKEDA